MIADDGSAEESGPFGSGRPLMTSSNAIEPSFAVQFSVDAIIVCGKIFIALIFMGGGDPQKISPTKISTYTV